MLLNGSLVSGQVRGGPGERVGRTQREALAAAAPGGPPRRPGLGNPRTPRDPTPGGHARPHAPKAREQPLAASSRSAPGRTSLPRTPYRRQPDSWQGPGRAEASERRAVLPSRRRAFMASHSRGAHRQLLGFGELCTAGPREAGASVTHLKSRGPESGTVAQTHTAPAAAAHQRPNSRLCACGAAIAELPSLPSFKPPANGGAKRRESA